MHGCVDIPRVQSKRHDCHVRHDYMKILLLPSKIKAIDSIDSPFYALAPCLRLSVIPFYNT